MSCRFDKTSIDKISHLRREYLNTLAEFQELYLELMIAYSDCFNIIIDQTEAGYCIKNKEGILIEFYLKKKFIPLSHEIFRSLLKELLISTIYCKSFDSLFLVNCLSNQLHYSLIGVLFRDYAEPLIEPNPKIIMERAYSTSEDLLFNQDNSIKELFETRGQLTQFITNEHVFIFSKSGEFVGCGMVIRTITDWEFCDLGVWVHPLFRGHGIGTQIIMKLREFAIRNHMKPSCGCATENIPSQKAIEKSGFVSRYKLLKFTV